MKTDFTEQQAEYMRAAIALARQGEGRVSPNPPVGCVIVKNGAIVGRGWHDRLGDLHAEAMALREAGAAAAGSTVYVTLSPCNSHGRQPPCADALVRAGVREVVVAAPDPNPANCSGVDTLNAAGVITRIGLLRKEAEYLARGFFKAMRHRLPYVTLKYAMTMDGKIAAVGGDSRWVSGPASREKVQDMRTRADAVMIGSGTALADNPLLNARGPSLAARGEKHPQPLRVVVDSRCRLPVDADMLNPAKGLGGSVLIACVRGANPRGVEALIRAGAAEVIEYHSTDGRVPLTALMTDLCARGVNNVLSEGGGELAAALLAEGLLDEVVTFVAPKLVGGSQAPGPVGGSGITLMGNAVTLSVRECIFVEDDIMITSIIRQS